ncbi:MAG TPA: hypothetical protein VM370_08335 [Candidatus Thermoplasmatota archaeon]|nr:hypothetical protein [Candidatus Thermoplasmatota archaeon]
MAALVPLCEMPPWWEPQAFRELAQAELSALFATHLCAKRLRGHPRPFDLVSEDSTLLGIVLPRATRGRQLTALQRAELSEAVLLLTCAPAQQRVLVVGDDPERLRPWLAVYGHLAHGIEIWHLRAPGELSRIAMP